MPPCFRGPKASARESQYLLSRIPNLSPKALAVTAIPTAMNRVIKLTIPAASRKPTPGPAYSNARMDRVLVPRGASRIMLLVVVAAYMKFITASSTRVGIIRRSQILKYVVHHPAPDTLACSSRSAPIWR